MKRKYKAVITAMIASAIMMTGCITSSASENKVRGATTGSTEETATTVLAPDNNYLITNVYGDGQKPWIVALEYGNEIDPGSVSVDDFSVEGYDITAVYTNKEASIPRENVPGKYVLIELSTDYTNSRYTTSGAPSGTTTGIPSGTPSGAPSGMSSEPSNQLTVTWTQTGEIKGLDGTTYVASGDSYTTDYNDNDNLLVKNFQQSTFTTEDGTSMMYNLYLPKGYREGKNYPLVLFMPDATGEGSDPYLTLTESLGGVIWTTKENQAQNNCIVLAPQYESTNSSNPAYTMELLQSVMKQYSVDSNRLYLVGQSSGTIRSIKLMIDNPNTFAGAMLVAGQADSEYVDKLSQLAGQNIWMICSAGDERAYPGMTAIKEAVEGAGTQVTTSQWSADLSDEEQKALCKKMEKSGATINWTVFDAGTVMEDDVPVSAVTEHMNTWRVAYNLSVVRNWLFKQTKN